MPEKILEQREAAEEKVEAPLSSPEQARETRIEKDEAREDGKLHMRRKHHPASDAQNQISTTAQRSVDPQVLAIEDILATDLDSFFMHLTPEHQQQFKTEGETTALKIQEALRKQTTKVKDIVNLIINWLKGLPGINRFFLEQEAKIKADTIMRRYRS